jgi:hypothetical protein
MNKTRSRRAELLAAVLTPLLGLGGCGGGGDGDDPRKIDGLVTIQMPTGGATFGKDGQASKQTISRALPGSARSGSYLSIHCTVRRKSKNHRKRSSARTGLIHRPPTPTAHRSNSSARPNLFCAVFCVDRV